MKAQDLFDKVTADLVAAIEDGASDWHMPWHRLANGVPLSVDGRPYRGWNALVLAMVSADREWPSNRWGTYRGWKRHGCQVRRGEHGTQVVLWKQIERQRGEGSPADVQADDSTSSRSLLARVFTVFAAEQVEGGDRDLPTKRPDQSDRVDRVVDAELYFAQVGARVSSGGNQACYIPALDEIHMPSLAQFDTPADCYSTAAHEHVHWTGHRDRLARDLTGRFGDYKYGAEELIAELGAAFWCAQFGLAQATRDDHAAYLGDWIRMLKADSRALVAACSHSQRAIDYLNERAGWATGAHPVDDDVAV